MPKRWTAILALATLLLGSAVPAAQAGDDHRRHDERIVGYFTQWGIYARGFYVRHLVDNGSARKLTDLNYAFGLLDPQGRCVSADPWADYQRPFAAVESVSGAGRRTGPGAGRQPEPAQAAQGQAPATCGSASRSAAGPARSTSPTRR